MNILYQGISDKGAKGWSGAISLYDNQYYPFDYIYCLVDVTNVQTRSSPVLEKQKTLDSSLTFVHL